MKIKKQDRRDILRALSLFTQLGLTMAFCVLIGVAAGWFLDSVFHTAPWLLFLFAVLGVGAAIKVMFDITTKD